MALQRQKKARVGVLFPFLEEGVRQGQNPRVCRFAKRKQTLPTTRADVLREGGETVIAERAHGFLFLTPAGRQKPVGRLAIFIPVFSPPFPKEKRIEPNEAVFLRPIVAFPPKEARPIECYNSGDSAD